MINLPNPFSSPGRLDLLPVDKAVASSPPVCGAAADPIVASSTATGGHQEASLAGPPNTRPASELLDEHRFVLDEERFMLEIEPLPLFLQAPIDVLNVLAAY